jgi:aspartyl-tRNA synthetase
MKDRIYIKDLNTKIGQEIIIMGWVSVRRDQGKMVFFDMRDMTGKVQCVVLPKQIENIKEVRPGWVLKITGIVNKRPDKNINSEILNGNIELETTNIEILNKSKTLPFEITEDTSEINEETRLKYRYLDLRSDRMQKNIRLRSEFVRKIREFLFSKMFTEIETPMLTESTPEGSRDFVVPSRLNPGNFYALPQSPQQYKQLLMVAGIEKYFQIAKALRDEDLRADRGFEHSQIDIEISFVEMKDVMNLVEEMIITVVESMGFIIKEKPFPRITHTEVMKKYGSDKFDIRTEKEKKENVLSYTWVTNFPFFEKTKEGKWTFTHNPFSMPIPEHIEWLLKGKNIGDILTTQYDLVCNGYESGGGSIRAHKGEILEATYKIMGYEQKEIKDKIGHILEAFKYVVPPHGGIALGVERNLMNLTSEKYLREVVAFPMTRGGRTAVMNAPKELEEKQLKELGIKISKKINPE